MSKVTPLAIGLDVFTITGPALPKHVNAKSKLFQQQCILS